jgi:hydrogenase maturation protein HypF
LRRARFVQRFSPRVLVAPTRRLRTDRCTDDKFIEVEGKRARVGQFMMHLAADAPAPISGDTPFAAESSRPTGATSVSVPPDLGTCDACLRELFDPANRRYRYPFINCAACGPRFTIARQLPYDRTTTTMAEFAMCDRCRAEYDAPADRRFHAGPNACPECGPVAWLADSQGVRVASKPTVDAVAAAARAIVDGAIVAVKGLGGYHLACRADDTSVVERLRRRTRRDDKPFALMAANIAMAVSLVKLRPSEMRVLTSDARPILLAERAYDAPVSRHVAPRRPELGVLLPYTPLHHLLIHDVGMPIVLTSGNVSDEPMAYRDDDAFDRLSNIADLFLTHDRPIETRCEDSVVRVVRHGGELHVMMLRRARGFVPDRIGVPVRSSHAILAAGGQVKNTTCLLRDDAALVGPHVGDLAGKDAFAAYARDVEHLTHLADALPAIVAHDLQPHYLSTKYAAERVDLAAEGIQHHHAHLAACLAEYGETGPAVGIIFDGAGLGTDGTIWGGEILFGDLGHCVRLGHLRAVRMPGGEAVVHEPWRMACAWLTDAHNGEPPLCASMVGDITQAQWKATSRLSRAPLSPITTSVGRLFDACAAIAGLRRRTTFEGQAAMELEACARELDLSAPYPVTVDTGGDLMIIDPRPMILAVERDAMAERDGVEMSCGVHGGLIYATRIGAQIAAQRMSSRTIVLSGGVFQNILMLETLASALEHDGLRVLVPRRLPPNDGGLSYGQAVVAAWRRRSHMPGDSGQGVDLVT